MSYKALYRTYRPKKFDEVVGQSHIVETLKNVIKKNKIAHAYLFAGPRGTGKTTLAQIFAQEINKNAVNSNQDFSLDMIEIDAASNNGITEIRSLIENSKFAPTEGFYKIYIIDEVHMLTKGAWNALLKILEEPPIHVVFILATTEPHKIPVTILSRTQRFNFKRIDNKLIYRQLTKVFEQEKIIYDQESLKFIAKLANGGLRDALTIADQTSAFGNGVISFEAISKVFGLISVMSQIEVLNLSFKNQTKQLIQTLHYFSENGVDLERLTIALIDILRDYIVFHKTNDATLITYLNLDDIQTLNLDLDFAYLALDELVKLAHEIKSSELSQHLFELTLLKITSSSKFENNPELPINLNNPITPIYNEVESIKNSEVTHFKTLQQNLMYNQDLHDLDIFPRDEFKQNEFKMNELSDNSSSQLDTLETITQNILNDVRLKSEQELTQEIMNDAEMIKNQTLIKINELESKNQSTITQKLIDPDYRKDDSHLSTIETKPQESELDIMKLFGLSVKNDQNLESQINKSIQQPYQISELINLLLLSDKKKLDEAKDRFNILTAYINSQDYGKYANWLAGVKIICAGENFLLVSSEETEIIEQLNHHRQLPDFLHLIEIIMGQPLWIYTINRIQFEEVKKTWNIMKAEQNLPTPKGLEKIVLVKNLSETEEFGQEIFGDLFDK